jgi:hypothetical protein
MFESNPQKQPENGFQRMTPAHIREPPAADYVEVVFLESARFYKLFKKTPAFDQIADLLRDAIDNNHAVQIRCTSPHGDVIEAIER